MLVAAWQCSHTYALNVHFDDSWSAHSASNPYVKYYTNFNVGKNKAKKGPFSKWFQQEESMLALGNWIFTFSTNLNVGLSHLFESSVIVLSVKCRDWMFHVIWIAIWNTLEKQTKTSIFMHEHPRIALNNFGF